MLPPHKGRSVKKESPIMNKEKNRAEKEKNFLLSSK